MSLGNFLIHATLTMASQIKTKSCNLQLGIHSNVSSGDYGVDSNPGQPSQPQPEEVRQISSSASVGSSGSESTQERDNQEALPQARKQQNSGISGTLTDETTDLVPGAEVVVNRDAQNLRRTVIADQNGLLATHTMSQSQRVVGPSASQVLYLDPGQFLIWNDIAPNVDGGPTVVVVAASPIETAERVRIAKRQRVLGFIPDLSGFTLLLSGRWHDKVWTRARVDGSFLVAGPQREVQVNDSSFGGNLASTAISESNYPASTAARIGIRKFAIGTGERMVSGLAQIPFCVS